MEFIERDVQYAGRKKITKLSVDPDNTNIIYAEIEKFEGEIYEEGTPINAENLNKGNWRDDKSVSFMKLNDDDLPIAKHNETQIATKSNGETWIVPPVGSGEVQRINAPNIIHSRIIRSNSGSKDGTSITVNVDYTLENGEFVSGVNSYAYQSNGTYANQGIWRPGLPSIGSTRTSVTFTRANDNSSYAVVEVFISKVL